MWERAFAGVVWAAYKHLAIAVMMETSKRGKSKVDHRLARHARAWCGPSIAWEPGLRVAMPYGCLGFFQHATWCRGSRSLGVGSMAKKRREDKMRFQLAKIGRGRELFWSGKWELSHDSWASSCCASVCMQTSCEKEEAARTWASCKSKGAVAWARMQGGKASKLGMHGERAGARRGRPGVGPGTGCWASVGLLIWRQSC